MKTAKLLMFASFLACFGSTGYGAITISVSGAVDSDAPTLGISSGDALTFAFSPIPAYESGFIFQGTRRIYSGAIENFSFALNEGLSNQVAGFGGTGSLTLDNTDRFEGLGIDFDSDALFANPLADHAVVDWTVTLLNLTSHDVVKSPMSATAVLFDATNWDALGGSIGFLREDPYSYITVNYSIGTMELSGDISPIPEARTFGLFAGVIAFGALLGTRRRR